MKIKKGDKVVVTAGKDKGTVGMVKELFPKKNRVIVEGVNERTKHVKPTQQEPEGGIQKIEATIDVSNLMLVLKEGKEELETTKLGYKIEKNKKGKNEKVRISKKTGEKI